MLTLAGHVRLGVWLWTTNLKNTGSIPVDFDLTSCSY